MQLKIFFLSTLFIFLTHDSFSQEIMYSQKCIYYPDRIYSAKFKKGYTKSDSQVPKNHRDVAEEDSFYGGEGYRYIRNIDLNVLLSNNTKYTYLPKDSFVILEFKNGIKSYEDSYDIIIQSCNKCSCGKETIDSAMISISSNNINYVKLGVVHSFESKGFNIDHLKDSNPFRYIKIEGLSAISFHYGFELLKAFGFKEQPELIPINNTLGTN